MEAFDSITNKSNDHQFLYEMLQKTMKSKDAEEGLKAFREKRKPKWLND
jgi:enoyl-CoA hydratase/carnithine racemase